MADGANIEIRPARADEMKDLNRVTGYAFANNDLPKEEPDPDPLQPEQSLCAFDGEQMVATSGAFDFSMRFNGRQVAADGVTMVSCDPGYRRRGIVRQLIDGLLQRSRSRDVPVSILWASMGAIYQRFGYGLATTMVGYNIPPRHIQFQFGERPAGEVRLMSREAALPHLQAIYSSYAESANGMLHRGELFWDLMLRRTGGQHTWIAVYFDEQGTATGYCLYRTRFNPALVPEASQVMDVFDFVWLDMAAYRGLWGYLGSHDLVDHIRLEYVAEDDPAPNLMLEPRMLRRKTWDGVWMRIVDVEAALAARGYELPGEAVVEIVDDELCPWNNGCYRLVAGGDEISVDRLSDSVMPDFTTRPEGLSSLISGHTRASELVRMGRASMTDVQREPILDSLFATRRRPHCPNMF